MILTSPFQWDFFHIIPVFISMSELINFYFPGNHQPLPQNNFKNLLLAKKYAEDEVEKS